MSIPTNIPARLDHGNPMSIIKLFHQVSVPAAADTGSAKSS